MDTMYDARQAQGSGESIDITVLDLELLTATGHFPANGLLYAGALDGKLRIADAATGKVLRVIDTKRPFDADNGIEGHGGAIDLGGVVVDGERLFLYSGYGMFGQMPGNILLAYDLAQD